MPNRIRELRKARGWRLEDLADLVGCGITYLSDLERGDRELSYHWMKRIARALRVQPAELLPETDNAHQLSADEHVLLALYDRASGDQKQQLLQMAKILIGEAPKGQRKHAA